MDEKEALKKLLLDSESLARLSAAQSFNVFDVLNIARTEIRHSNVLAWLLNPKENHGLGDKILSAFVECLVKREAIGNVDPLKLLTMNFSDVTVLREWKSIDLLIVSDDERLIICIENKIDANDHSHQLDKYYDCIKTEYSDYGKIFLYLTPDGRAPLEDEGGNWQCIGYETVIDVIEKEASGSNLPQDVKYFINDYVKVLRREIMEDKDLIELCQSIYKKHKDALDLIFEYRPDRLQTVSEYFRAWCRHQDSEGKIIFCEKNCSKSYTRFRTSVLDGIILPTEAVSGWGTNVHYFYEIASYLDKDGSVKFAIQLGFSSHQLEPDNIARLEEIDRLVKGKDTIKPKWQWRSVCKSVTGTVKPDDELPDINDTDNYIFSKLNAQFRDIMKVEEKIAMHYNK